MHILDFAGLDLQISASCIKGKKPKVIMENSNAALLV